MTESARIYNPSYALIGRTLLRIQPDAFTEIKELLSRSEVVDISRIKEFYIVFTENMPDTPSYVEQRRIFVAAMLKLYRPCLLENSVGIADYGFATTIAGLFKVSKSLISKNIREVVVHYDAYQDFSEAVDRLVEIFKTIVDSEKEKK